MIAQRQPAATNKGELKNRNGCQRRKEAETKDVFKCSSSEPGNQHGIGGR